MGFAEFKFAARHHESEAEDRLIYALDHYPHIHYIICRRQPANLVVQGDVYSVVG